jgi:AAA+ ATPase superfamily predicted ATPase
MEKKLKKPHKEGAHSLVEVMMTWEARGEEEESLASHLNTPPKGITVLTAPKGAGKSALVNTVLRGRENVVYIDFSQVDAIPDADFIDRIFNKDCP